MGREDEDGDLRVLQNYGQALGAHVGPAGDRRDGG